MLSNGDSEQAMEIAENTLSIRQIKQEDDRHFSIVWQDGEKRIYSLDEIQAACPCARCREELSKKRVAQASLEGIYSVGTYALKFNFQNDCSEGIYTYSLLKDLGQKQNDKN